jgi:putative ABC transport system ATP-binding protein
MTDRKPLIEIEDMYKIYDMGSQKVNALDGISLKIYDGEFVAIIGKSGSGKSTLMNMVGCLDLPTSGKYYLDGIDIADYSDDQLSHIRNKKIGFIFQQFNLFKKLSSLENVEMPAKFARRPRDKRRKRAIEALELVGLGDRLDHTPAQLSGGQQQRVAVARSIVNSPPVILADEPTGNLDSKSAVDVIDMIHELHKKGNTIILITHDDDVANEADRIIRLKDGKITADEKEGIS